jgi:SAM-dependent methyltransferase
MTVPNPWLDIPLADYEGHMALAEVGQARLLAEQLAAAVQRHAPRSVAVLGCAGGNGFDRVPEGTRLVGVDLNPAYIATARSRHGRRSGLELHVGDLSTEILAFAPVELGFAGLLFEHVDVASTLRHVAAKLLPGGLLVAVLQLPHAEYGEITPSPYTSLAALGFTMRLVPPDALAAAAAACGYTVLGTETVAASGGKQFAVQTFRKNMEER